jgi:hypothetical protein
MLFSDEVPIWSFKTQDRPKAVLVEWKHRIKDAVLRYAGIMAYFWINKKKCKQVARFFP